MKSLFSLFLLFCASIVFAQQVNLSGSVKDNTNNPLPGVNIFIKGTKKASVTDFDGNYQIQAQKGDILIFSFVGMKQKAITVADNTTLNVILEEDSAALSEVVVTALGIGRKKKALGYAVQSVKAEKLNLAGTTNINNALAGKVAGVQFLASSDGDLEGTPRVRIRGVNTLAGGVSTTSGNPLYVVDGTPILDPASINMDDVAEMTVLKGAGASVLYGSRGLNGVILIKTKSASSEKGKLDVRITQNFTISKVARWYDSRFQNEYGGGYKQEFDKFTYIKGTHPEEWKKFNEQPIVNYNADESWGPRFEGQMVRHWDSWYEGDEFGKLRAWKASPTPASSFFDIGMNNRIATSIAKSGKGYSALLSYTNVNVKGIIPLSKSNTNYLTSRIKLDLNKSLTAEGSINYTDRKIQGDFGNKNYGNPYSGMFDQWYQMQIDLNRLKKYKQVNKDGSTVYRTWNIRSPKDLRGLYWDSPYRDFNENKRAMSNTFLTGFVSLQYKIGDIITLKGISRNSTNFYGLEYFNAGSRRHRFIDGYANATRKTVELNHEFLATYKDKFLDDVISVNGLFGANVRNYKDKQLFSQTQGGLAIKKLETIGNSKEGVRATSNKSEREVRSIYGSFSLGYDEFLFGEVSLRSDYSSTLPKENNKFTYPGFSGSLVVSKLLKDFNVLPNFISLAKLRGSWAQVGNDTQIAQLQNTYSLSSNAWNGNPIQNTQNIKANENLKAALSTSQEVGLEVKLLESRIGFDFAYFRNVNTNQIINIPTSVVSGYRQAKINAGKIINKGWEGALNIIPFKNEILQWDVDINLSKSTPIISSLYPEKNIRTYSLGYYAYAKEQEKYGVFRGDKPKMVDGKPLLASNGKYIKEQDIEKKYVEGKYVIPDYTGGFATSINYNLPKNLGSIKLAAAFDFQIGGYIVDGNKRYMDHSGIGKETVGTNDLGNRYRDLVKDKTGKKIGNGYGAVKVENAHSESGGMKVSGIEMLDKDGKVTTDYEKMKTTRDVSYYIHPKSYFHYSNTYRPYHSLYDASYLKLRELSLSYKLPKTWLSEIGATAASVGFVIRNFLLYKDPGISVDPSQSSGYRTWMTYGQFPSTETLGANLNINF